MGVLYFLDPIGEQASAVMNVASGFDSFLQFFYSAIYFKGAATVYSGLNGTGSILATVVLPVLGVSDGPG